MNKNLRKNILLFNTYIHRQAQSFFHYVFEQLLTQLLGWIPTVLGIAIRCVFYKLIMNIKGLVAIEKNVKFRFCNNIRLGNGVYIDENTYFHATPKGIQIGERTFIMHGAILHVYNFRNLPRAGITIGKDCLIGEYSVLRGQGGIRIGDRVYTSPFTQILAVNHVFENPNISFTQQGITAKGITIEDDVWLGAGSIITDGVHIGKGSVIAAGAVVVSDVPSHSLVAGVPARVVKQIEGTEEETIEEIFY